MTATPVDNDQVRKVQCIVMVPQVVNHQSVTLPENLPDHKILEKMEPLGWIHTQLNELTQNNKHHHLLKAHVFLQRIKLLIQV